MTGWILFLCILALIFFILFMPAVVDFRYEEEKTWVRISYCGIPVFDTARKDGGLFKKSDKKPKQKKEKKKKAKKTEEAAKEKKPLSERIDFIQSLLKPVGKGLRRLCKGIRITRFYLDIQVGAFDAAECALAYGRMYAAVANSMAFFQSFFVIKPDHIAIYPRFGTEKTVYTVRFRGKLSPAAVLAAGFSIVFTYLIQMLRKDSQQNPKKKNKEDSQHAGTEG